MASKMQEEVTCPICMDILKEPVTIDCGHNFCLGCISQVGEAADSLLCPLCNASVSRSTFRPNKMLANLAEKIQAMDPSDFQGGDELGCKKHKEKFHYFCEEDGEFLCSVCRDTKDHKSHHVSLIEEAAQNYQWAVCTQARGLQQLSSGKCQSLHLNEDEQQSLGHLGNQCWATELQSQADLTLPIPGTEKNCPLKILVGQMRGTIQSQVDILGQKEKEILGETARGESMIRVFRTRMHLERLKILDEFNSLRQSLEEEESFLLARLGWLEQEGAKQMKRFVTDAQKQLSFLRNLTESLEAKKQMAPKQVLQDIKVILNRSERFQFINSTPAPGDLAKSISETKSRHVSIIESLKEFKDRLQADGKEDQCRFLDSLKEEDKESSPVTLDASSAHEDLTLSQDLKTVRLDDRTVHKKDSNKNVDPQRFYPSFSVLGSPGISSGCRIWEVELQWDWLLLKFPSCCVVGVASELVPRQGHVTVKPLNGFWALQVYPSRCWPLTDSRTQENVHVCLNKVGIFVNYDCGEVVFYDATTNDHIYTFHASFTGKVFPFFQLLDTFSQITLIP
ncbi:E3 ubiquitin-protein ligase TRIM31-like [Nannospalax galili]|uniref:E3 ubiquitin-protein ligase TRIM31-like n=1 Tax=Nannospalax galili TaxID=1026970 RepID=UPI00111C59A0|nr:E3 ubiquitin-protein ligase TRIM31-like [Nannospalax galili]